MKHKGNIDLFNGFNDRSKSIMNHTSMNLIEGRKKESIKENLMNDYRFQMIYIMN